MMVMMVMMMVVVVSGDRSTFEREIPFAALSPVYSVDVRDRVSALDW